MQPAGERSMGSGVSGEELGTYGFKVQGWVDHFETWRRDLVKRIKAESDTAVDYLIGADLIAEAAGRAKGGDAGWLRERAAVLRSEETTSELRTHATDPMLHELVLRYPDKRFATNRVGADDRVLIRCERGSVHGTNSFRVRRLKSRCARNVCGL